MPNAIKFPIDLTLGNGEVIELEAGAPDLIRLERTYNIAIAGMIAADGQLGAGFRIEYLAFLAWSAARRRRIDAVPTNFEDFAASDFGIDLRDEDAAPDLTAVATELAGQLIADRAPDGTVTVTPRISELLGQLVACIDLDDLEDSDPEAQAA